MRRLAALAVLLATAGLESVPRQAAPAQAPAPAQLTFRVDATYIEVDAVVTDGKGAFVRDLSAADFEVLEDRRPQTVDVFALVDIPLERADRPLFRPEPIEPDVVANDKEFEGRVYVLLLDANHVEPQNTFLAKRAAQYFIDQYIGPNDLAAVVLAQTGRRDDSREFTSSRAALRVAVDKFVGEKVKSKSLSVREFAVARQGRGFDALAEARDPNAMERAAKARNTVEALRRVSSYMAGIRGRRKAVVLFSEGLDFNLDDPIGPRSTVPGGGSTGLPRNPVADNSNAEALYASGLIDLMQGMFEVASRANVAIYSVDPRGVTSETELLMQAGGMPEGSTLEMTAVTAGVRDELRRQIGTLRTFSENTGGLAFVGSNDFATGFRKIVEDNSAYYVLGYHVRDLRRDGRFRAITVRVKRPGLQVRARKGYYAPRDTNEAASVATADPTITLLNSPMPMGGLLMRLSAATLRGTPGKHRVVVALEFEGRDLAFSDAPVQPQGNQVDISYVALDMGGTIHASGRKALDLSVSASSRQSVAANGLRLVTEFELPPGRYQLRMAGHQKLTGKSGSVFRDLEVPDYGRGALVMSPLLLSSASAGRTPTSLDAPSVRSFLPGPPTARREFALEDTLAVFAEVIDNDGERPHRVDLVATLRTDDTGTEVFEAREERSSADLGGASGSYGFLARIPLRDFVPGRYVLTVEASSRLGGQAAKREVRVGIR
jgi:VWFA-related protein